VYVESERPRERERERESQREREREKEREVLLTIKKWLKVGRHNALWVTPPLGARAQHMTAGSSSSSRGRRGRLRETTK
jgi:hypothetical protein